MSTLRQVATSQRQIDRPTLCIIHVYILGMTLRRAIYKIMTATLKSSSKKNIDAIEKRKTDPEIRHTRKQHIS